MKTAIVHISVLEFTCPECKEHIAASTGSHMFPTDEPLPDEFECDCCGAKLKVPAKARKLGR